MLKPIPSRIAALRIPEQGRTYGISLGLPWLGAACEAGLEGTWNRFDGEITLQRLRERVEVCPNIESSVQTHCESCGAEIVVEQSYVQPLVYLPSNFDPRDKANRLPKSVKELERISNQVGLDEDDLDIGWYDNGELDVAASITEMIVLHQPSLLHCGLDGVRRIDEGTCLFSATEQ
jgi:hypothetical protein